jgi:hypothetical protein
LNLSFTVANCYKYQTTFPANGEQGWLRKYGGVKDVL